MEQLPSDVMKDLMVIYLAGEASPGTRVLVEDYARSHPGYASLLRSASTAGKLDAVTPANDREMAALRKTRQFVFLRSLFFGVALACTLMPFTIVFRNGTITFLLLRDVPGLAAAFWSVAAAGWVAYYGMHRAVKKAGL